MFNLLLAAAISTALSPQLPRHATFGAALEDRGGGAEISRVIPGSAASGAGLTAGDVLTSLAGVATPNTAAFLAEIHRLHAGERVNVVFRRGGVVHQVSVVLGAPANESDARVDTAYDVITVDGTLRRTLVTMPKGATGRLPAMLVMGGIGCYSVDAAANPQDAYMRLAHDVSAAGFVTMRVEKSGVGDSQGPPCVHVDFNAEQRAYASALRALAANPHVDVSRIYLFGHSIGSLEAPLLARSSHVAGVIAAEAVGRDWTEYEVRNVRRQSELSGDSPAAVDAAVALKQECMVRLLLLNEPEATIERSRPQCKDPNGVYPVDAPYMQQVARVKIIDQWASLDVPVLAIYGDSDFVTEKADHERIVAAVNAHHPGSATFSEIPGMDHLLFTAATPRAAMDLFSSGAARTYDADFSAAVIQWLTRASSTAK